MPPPTSIPSPCKWDTKAISREFGFAVDTVTRKLNAAKQVPAADGTWATVQIVAALFGDIHGERLRKTAAEADNWELKNAILRGESLPKALLTPALTEIFTIVRQLVMASSMTNSEKGDLLNTIATWPVAVATVAQKAARSVKLEHAEGEIGHDDSGQAGTEAEEA
jgi:hypothetical protein